MAKGFILPGYASLTLAPWHSIGIQFRPMAFMHPLCIIAFRLTLDVSGDSSRRLGYLYFAGVVGGNIQATRIISKYAATHSLLHT